jgi:hypothetical protein
VMTGMARRCGDAPTRQLLRTCGRPRQR